MAQRQFRDDDTSIWEERYGNGANGTLIIAIPTTESAQAIGLEGTSSVSGTSLKVSSVSGFAVDDLLWISQLEYDTHSSYGNWEFNKIAGTVSGTIHTKYPLTHDYYAGGIAYKCKQYKKISVQALKQWQAPTSGIEKGILIAFCNGTLNNYGTIGADELGFGGGAGKPDGQAGDTGGGVLGAGVQQYQRRVNAGGGGSGGNASGGGGANGSNGTAGKNVGGTGGEGGITVGATNLTTMCKGGGGGSGDNHTGYDLSAYGGGAGGGIIMMIAPTINSPTGIFSTNGQWGASWDASNEDNDGGGGAGGSGLLKGIDINVGTAYALKGLGGGIGGGNGGVGRLHCDYGNSLTIASSPIANYEQHNILNAPLNTGGMLIASEI